MNSEADTRSSVWFGDKRGCTVPAVTNASADMSGTATGKTCRGIVVETPLANANTVTVGNSRCRTGIKRPRCVSALKPWLDKKLADYTYKLQAEIEAANVASEYRPKL